MAKIAVTGLMAIDALAELSGESFHQFTLILRDVSERLASLSRATQLSALISQ